MSPVPRRRRYYEGAIHFPTPHPGRFWFATGFRAALHGSCSPERSRAGRRSRPGLGRLVRRRPGSGWRPRGRSGISQVPRRSIPCSSPGPSTLPISGPSPKRSHRSRRPGAQHDEGFSEPRFMTGLRAPRRPDLGEINDSQHAAWCAPGPSFRGSEGGLSARPSPQPPLMMCAGRATFQGSRSPMRLPTRWSRGAALCPATTSRPWGFRACRARRHDAPVLECGEGADGMWRRNLGSRDD